MRTLLILLLSIFCSIDTYSQTIDEHYEHAYQQIKDMLEGKSSLDFKRAVFLTENAYLEGSLDSYNYLIDINNLAGIVLLKYYNNNPQKQRMHHFGLNEAIYQLITDDNLIILDEGIIFQQAFNYDFEDRFGIEHWENTFVTELLQAHKGNCRSLVYLYKILADEVGADVKLSLAPNHIYLKHQRKGNTWYNTELTNKSFPSDTELKTTGHISLEALKNGIYLAGLTEQECIALTLIDLAHGFAQKHKQQNEESFYFQMKCVDLALYYYTNYINGLLLKANLHYHYYEQRNEVKHLAKAEKVCADIHKVGYQQLPDGLYEKWLEGKHFENSTSLEAKPFSDYQKEMLSFSTQEFHKQCNKLITIGELVFDVERNKVVGKTSKKLVGGMGRWLSKDRMEYKKPDWTPYRNAFNNPLRYFDPDGNFEIDKTTAKKYPALNKFLQNIERVYQGKPEAFRQAFKKYSDLSDKQILELLRYKQVEDGTEIIANQANPRIVVTDLDQLGHGVNGYTPGEYWVDLDGKLMTEYYRKAGGNVIKTDAKGVIELDVDIVELYEETQKNGDEIEKYAGLLLLESTVFHEATHYGDMLVNEMSKYTPVLLNPDGTKKYLSLKGVEGGASFEKAAYGTDIGDLELKTKALEFIKEFGKKREKYIINGLIFNRVKKIAEERLKEQSQQSTGEN